MSRGEFWPLFISPLFSLRFRSVAFTQWLYTYWSIIYLSFSAFDSVFPNGRHGQLWKRSENTKNPCIRLMALKLDVKRIIRDEHPSPLQKTHLKTPNTVQNHHLELSSAQKAISKPSDAFASTTPRSRLEWAEDNCGSGKRRFRLYIHPIDTLWRNEAIPLGKKS